MYVRQHAARQLKSCQAVNISCPDFKYFTYNKQEMKNHVAKINSINFQAINGLHILREGVSELLLAPTTSEKKNMERNNGKQVIR